MLWEEIRRHFPDQWVLLEALKAHSEQGKRIVERLAVLGMYPDSVAAMKAYSELHREQPTRELYVFHSSRQTLDIEEARWLGVRGA